MLRASTAAVCSLACALCTFSANALTVDATFGFDGFYAPGRWTPVTVRIDNFPRADKAYATATDFKGTCELRAAGIAGENNGVIFSRVVEVPAKDRKRICLYVKMPAMQEQTFNLVEPSGRVAVSVNVTSKPADPTKPLVVFVHTVDSGFFLPEIPDVTQPQVASIEPTDIPDKWCGYDGAKMVVIPRMTETLFDEEKVQALKEWVSQGGQLLVLGGRDGQSYTGSLLEKTLPGTYEGSDPYEFGDAGLRKSDTVTSDSTTVRIQVNRLAPYSDTSILYSSGGVPLLFARPMGAGRVLYMACDYSARMFRKIPMAGWLSASLIMDCDFNGARDRYDHAFLFRDQAIFGMGNVELPNLSLVMGILGSYLLIVGPLNFWILAKKKRLELAWLTVPCIVLLYSGGIYALSSRINGNDSFQANFHFVTTRSNSNVGRCDTLTRLFVPKPGLYGMKPTQEDATACIHAIWTETHGGGMFQRVASGTTGAWTGSEAKVIQTASGMALPSRHVRQWDYSDFTQFESVTQFKGPIIADLTKDASTISGTLKNSSGKVLKNPYLVLGGMAWPILEGVRPVDLKSGAQIASGDSGEISLNIAVRKGAALSSGLNPFNLDERERAVFNSFAKVIGAEDYPGSDLPPCFIVGTLESPPLDITCDRMINHLTDSTVIAIACSLKASGARTKFDISMRSQYIPSADLWQGYSLTPNAVALTQGKSAAFAFNLPFDEVMPEEFSARNTFQPRTSFADLGCDTFNFDTMNWHNVNMELEDLTEEQKRELHEDLDSRGTPNGSATFSGNSAIGIANPISGGILVRVSQKAKTGLAGIRDAVTVAAPHLQQLTLVPGAKETQ